MAATKDVVVVSGFVQGNNRFVQGNNRFVQGSNRFVRFLGIRPNPVLLFNIIACLDLGRLNLNIAFFLICKKSKCFTARLFYRALKVWRSPSVETRPTESFWVVCESIVNWQWLLNTSNLNQRKIIWRVEHFYSTEPVTTVHKCFSECWLILKSTIKSLQWLRQSPAKFSR